MEQQPHIHGQASGSVDAAVTDTIIARTELRRIENEVRGRQPNSRSMLPQEKSAVIVAGLFDLWEKELGKPGVTIAYLEFAKVALILQSGDG